MACTQLSSIATPGKRYSFLAKSARQRLSEVYTRLSPTATPGRQYLFTAKGWSSAALTGINLETGEPYNLVGYTFGSRAKGFDAVSGKYINYAIKIGKHILVID